MKTIITRDMAARALDLTHGMAERGPRTYIARQKVATWLDLGGKVTQEIRLAVLWLTALAR